MAAGQGNKLTNPIYTSKKVNGRCVPNDSRSYVDYLTDITSISNAYVGMKVLVWKEDENAQTELNKWYKVTAVNSLKKPTEYEEDGGAGNAQVTTESTVKPNSTNPVQSGAVYTALQDKADSATTLAGYGITDAKIASGTITLGSNTITPLTSHQDISGKADTADVGAKANLTTTAKGTLVAAINEIDANVGAARVMLYNILNGTSYSTIAQIEAAEQQNNA